MKLFIYEFGGVVGFLLGFYICFLRGLGFFIMWLVLCVGMGEERERERERESEREVCEYSVWYLFWVRSGLVEY